VCAHTPTPCQNNTTDQHKYSKKALSTEFQENLCDDVDVACGCIALQRFLYEWVWQCSFAAAMSNAKHFSATCPDYLGGRLWNSNWILKRKRGGFGGKESN
jgi:hypothetical protein